MRKHGQKMQDAVFSPANILLGLILVIFIISAAVVFTLHFRQLYVWEIDWLQLEAYSGYSREEILLNYNALIDYNSIFGTPELLFPTLPMSETGRIHFEEVKQVFAVFEIALLCSTVLGAVGIFWQHKHKRNGYLLAAGIFTVAIPTVLGILIALNWQTVFVLFHQIVFRNGYWIFDWNTDPVIRILPDAFFMHCAVMIISLVLLGAICCLTLYFLPKKRKRR